MVKQNAVIGLDIGHSAVKVAFVKERGGSMEARTMLFPSVVLPAFSISDDAEARRALADTVTVDGRKYFVGETAAIQGGRNAAPSQDEEWTTKAEYKALMQAAIHKLRAEGVLDTAVMVAMGLPTHLFGRQRDELRKLGEELFGPSMEIKVLPQPMGAYQFNMLDENGFPGKHRSYTDESWGVVEIGHFSTDFLLMQKARWVERASGACSGVKDAADQLQKILAEKRGITRGLLECEQALRDGTIRHFGETMEVAGEVNEAVEVLVNEIIETATRKLDDYAAGLDGVVLAGGGASIIHSALQQKWPHVRLVENPRFAVSEGFRRFGQGVLNAREVS